MTKEAGYKSAVTMLRGNVKSETDRYLLPRIPINHRTMPHLFLLKILTRYEDKNKSLNVNFSRNHLQDE